jgi:hypothetical protein
MSLQSLSDRQIISPHHGNVLQLAEPDSLEGIGLLGVIVGANLNGERHISTAERHLYAYIGKHIH